MTCQRPTKKAYFQDNVKLNAFYVRNSLLAVRTEDGNVFEIVCRQAEGKEDGRTTANLLFIMNVGLLKNHRHRFYYRGIGWNRPDSPQGTK